MITGTTEVFYNKRELLREFLKQTPYVIAYMTLFDYEKKGYLVPAGYVANGMRQMPIYTIGSLYQFIHNLEEAKRIGKIRLKRKPDAALAS